MSYNRNFNNTIKPNNQTEQIDVLRAVIEKKPIYFYQWDDRYSRIVAKKFDGLLPNFALYRYDQNARLADVAKFAMRVVEDAYIKGVPARATISQPGNAPSDAQVRMWFENGVLQIEPLGNTVIHDTRLAPTQPVAPVTDVKGSNVVDIKTQLETIVVNLRRELGKKGAYYRTAQTSENPNTLYVPDSYDLKNTRRYYVILRCDNAVFVSENAVDRQTMVGSRWNLKTLNGIAKTVSPGYKAKFLIDGVRFEVHRPQ